MVLRKLSVVLLVCGLFVYAANAESKIEIKSKVDSLSYSVGYNIGQNLLQQFANDTISFIPDLCNEGMKDALNKATAKLSAEQIQTIMMSLQQELMVKREAQRVEMDKKRKVAGDENKKKGDAFLAENKTKEGVKVTESGLQYKVITLGKGKKPTTANDVKVHYKGMLIDGKVFDSSIERKEPVTFPVTGVIKGWTEVLQLMPEGSKYMVYIPSELAYAERGAGRDIGPNEVLVFEVELLQVLDKQEVKPVQVDTKPDPKKK